PTGRNLRNPFTVEHITARIDLVGRWMWRLLEKLQHSTVLVRGDTPETPRIGNTLQLDRHIGVVTPVAVHQRTDIGSGQDVPVTDNHIVGTETFGHVTNRTRRVQRLLFEHVLQLQTELRTVAEILLENFGPVRRAEHD